MIGQTLLSLPLIENKTASDMPPPANDLAMIYTVNDSSGAARDWLYTYYSGGIWHPAGLTHFGPGRGYHSDGFTSEVNITYERNL